MLILPIVAALGASLGWAAGFVLAQWPSQQLGSFEFTRIQLIACAAILAALNSGLGYWPTLNWEFWPSYAASIGIGMMIGNLAMIECLRRGGPRRTAVLLSLQAPLVGAMAFVWLDEVPSWSDLFAAGLTLFGVLLAVMFGNNSRSQSDVPTGNLAIVIILGVVAAASYGFGFLVLKPALFAGVEPLVASAIRLLGASLLISIVALWPAKALKPQTAITPYLLGRTILPGFIGYGISSTLLLYAFANFDAGIAAVLGSLAPVFVLPILWLKEGVAPRPQAIIGATLAVAGTSLIILC